MELLPRSGMRACGHGDTSPSLFTLTFTDIHGVVEAEAIKGALPKRQCIVLTSHGRCLGQMTGDCDLTRKTKTKATKRTRGVFIPDQQPGQHVELCIKKNPKPTVGGGL